MMAVTVGALLVAVFGTMIVEAMRAARNERAQIARGGIEPAGDVYALMRIAYPGIFAAMILEGLWRGGPWSSAAAVEGAVLFVAAKLLKWSAIRALGPYWTFRVVVVPGAPLVRRGPYRFMRHPNYVGVAGEIVGVALMTGATVAGPLSAIVFAALLLKRLSVEERALKRAATGV